MRKTYLILLFALFCVPAFADTHYMGTGEEYTNLQAAFAAGTGISGGDTLIIRDDIYFGATNVLDSTHMPPNGTAGAYTIIKAETDGGVIFDGEAARDMFVVASDGAKYWKFEGIEWVRPATSSVTLRYSDYVKFLRCGVKDAADGAAGYSNWFITEASYILCEGCYSYGSGRYKFLAYKSDYVIFRSCVARSDRVATAGAEAMAQFQFYSSNYCLAQNCIVVDSDQVSYYSCAEAARFGPFCFAATDSSNANGSNDSYTNCIAVNVDGGITSSGNVSTIRNINCSWTNCVLWDVRPRDQGTLYFMNWLRGDNDTLNHCTFGGCTLNNNVYSDYIASYTAGAYETTIKNSLFASIANANRNIMGDAGSGFGVEHQNNNYYTDNTADPNNTGTDDSTVTNFLWSAGNTSGGLKYLPRIETDSNISGLADDDGDIGANLDYLIGEPGTLYGDMTGVGYDGTTSTKMWPFPNEDLIKTKMAAYSYDDGGGGAPEITGARGFATGTSIDGSSQTLTKYIWEYLGNEIPASVYGGEEEPAISTGSSGIGGKGLGGSGW